MRKALTFTAVLLLMGLVASAAFAREVNNGARPQQEMVLGETLQPSTSQKAMVDTTWFGNTVWNAGASRWQAVAGLNNRNNRWTFDSGVNGNLEGWWGYDLTKIPPPTRPLPTPDNADFRYTNDAIYAVYGTPATDLFPTATPADNGGIWCSKYEPEADELCYVAGQGYGTGWGHEAKKTFTYGGTGDVRITYRYWNNSEKAFDFTYLYLEFNGVRESVPRVTQTLALGSPTSKRTKTLTVAAASITPGTTGITAVFRFTSDSGWSDEDGVGFTTTYGGFCCYNFKYEDLGTPANTDEDTWEGGTPEGWTFVQPTGLGHFTGIRNVADLPPPETTCPCIGPVLQGNVLVQYDQSAGPGDPAHPDGQDAFAMSPYIDLDAAGVGASPVKFVLSDSYQALPLSNAVYYKVQLRQYPVLCEATGATIEAFVAPDPFITYTPNPTCFNEAIWEDFRTVSPDIDYCWIAIESLSLCSVSTNCVGAPGGNTTPWWDNMTLAVTGTPGAPAVASTEIRPFLQDIFAADGSLRPKSSCIMDNSGDAQFGTTASDADLEDTMYVTAAHVPNNGGVQVNLHFRYTKGPGTTAAHAFFTRYPTQNTWYEARCDSGRSGPVITEISDTWCSEYHESSAYFAGENADANEIIPDRLFTPGSKIEYYWSSNYVNTPGVRYYWPDVPAGELPLSVNTLPGMKVNVPGDTLWPCTLYINGDSRQPLTITSAFNQIEPALNLALGGTAGGTRLFDRYDDVLIGSNTNASFGRQVTGENGFTEIQSLGYRTIVGGYGFSETYTITDEDANLLSFWLTTTVGGANDNRQILYFSGDGLAVDMSSIAPPKPNATALLNNYFGAILQCNPYRVANCPTGSNADTTFCVQLQAATGAEPSFAFTGAPYRARGNGCPTERRFSVLQVNAGVASALQNLDYDDQDASGDKGTTHYASVTNDRAGAANGNYRTVFDGVGLSRYRRPVAANWDCSRDSLAIIDRLDDVITWGSGGASLAVDCRPGAVTGVDPGDHAGAPRANGLQVGPNPFNPLVKLNFAVATPGKVSLRIYDVRGALVSTLVDEFKTQGRYQALWTGMDDSGRKMASGVFWAKFSVGDSDITRQLVLLK
jgi:hypothetical protein